MGITIDALEKKLNQKVNRYTRCQVRQRLTAIVGRANTRSNPPNSRWRLDSEKDKMEKRADKQSNWMKRILGENKETNTNRKASELN